MTVATSRCPPERHPEAKRRNRRHKKTTLSPFQCRKQTKDTRRMRKLPFPEVALVLVFDTVVVSQRHVKAVVKGRRNVRVIRRFVDNVES
jgi:hypothetical protein